MSEDYDEIFKSDIWRRLRTLTKTSALPEKKTQEKTTMLGRWRRRNSLVKLEHHPWLFVCIKN